MSNFEFYTRFIAMTCLFALGFFALFALAWAYPMFFAYLFYATFFLFLGSVVSLIVFRVRGWK